MRLMLIHYSWLLTSGKSTIGLSLSRALDIPFIDGDSLHPKTNVAKMTAGQPLTDEDRLPWLALIRSTAERVCREEWRRGERAVKGVIHDAADDAGAVGGGATADADIVQIGAAAEFEFGEGDKWRKGGKKADEIEASLGRPAVIIACSALKKRYRDILRGEVEAEPPSKENIVSGRSRQVMLHPLLILLFFALFVLS